MRLVDRLFRKEEINGYGLCPTYLFRWTLFSLGWFKVYLHKFIGDDWSRDMHDHPKRFISIGLRGRYIEETPTKNCEWRAPWFRTFPANHIHRIRSAYSGGCWTLVLVFRTVRPWGFCNKGRWIPWRDYVKSDAASDNKSCP